jgi:hypothetical protein
MTKTTKIAPTPVCVCLLPADLENMQALTNHGYSCSRSMAARIAVRCWHDFIEENPSVRAKRKPAEFAERVSPKTGGKTTKFYLDGADLDRLERLKTWTGEKVVGRLIRAAIGWHAARLG